MAFFETYQKNYLHSGYVPILGFQPHRLVIIVADQPLQTEGHLGSTTVHPALKIAKVKEFINIDSKLYI